MDVCHVSEAHLRDAIAEITCMPDSGHEYYHEYLQLRDTCGTSNLDKFSTTPESPFYILPLVPSASGVWAVADKCLRKYTKVVMHNTRFHCGLQMLL